MKPRAASFDPPTSGLLLLPSAAFLLAPLARFWTENEDYNFGWGVPVLAGYLAYERWRRRPEPGPLQPALFGIMAVLALWGAVVLGTRLVLETEPASRPLLWLNTSLLAGALLAWMDLLGGRPWLRHFAFPAGFLLVGVPWIFGFEFLVVQDLMRLNASAVAGALGLLDVAAHAAGNTIVLPTGQLGVSEACSGIRSLQATLMMSLFFGEFYRYGVRGRVALVAAGAVLALAGNFARMLYLAWRGAQEGLGSVEAAHDSTGWLILVFTVVALWFGCVCTRVPYRPHRSAAPRPMWPARRAARAWAVGVLAATLLAELMTQGWYGWRETAAPHYPGWLVAWPESADHFQRLDVSGAAREKLRAGEASAASWRDAAGIRWSGLWLRYGPRASGKVVFESHNPGLCLPAAGWLETAESRSFPLQVGDVHLAVESLTFRVADSVAYVFWIPYLDGGVRADADREPGLYGRSFAALARGRLPWLADVWAGCRGVQAETLELALVGPRGAKEAEQAFRRLAPTLIRPETPRPATLAANGR